MSWYCACWALMFDLQNDIGPEMVAHACLPTQRIDMKFNVISNYVVSLGPAWDMSNHVSNIEKKKYFEKRKLS